MYIHVLYRTVPYCEMWTEVQMNQPTVVCQSLAGRVEGRLGVGGWDPVCSTRHTWAETHHINRIYPSQSYQSNQNFWCYYRCGYCLSFIVSEENIAGYINMANFKLFDIFGFNVSTLIVQEVPMSSRIMTWMGDSFEAESWIYCN